MGPPGDGEVSEPIVSVALASGLGGLVSGSPDDEDVDGSTVMVVVSMTGAAVLVVKTVVFVSRKAESVVSYYSVSFGNITRF